MISAEEVFARKAVLFKEGQPAEALCLLTTGSVDLSFTIGQEDARSRGRISRWARCLVSRRSSRRMSSPLRLALRRTEACSRSMGLPCSSSSTRIRASGTT